MHSKLSRWAPLLNQREYARLNGEIDAVSDHFLASLQLGHNGLDGDITRLRRKRSRTRSVLSEKLDEFLDELNGEDFDD